MRPAPKNPTPDGMAAETRALSQVMGPLSNAKVEQMQKRQDPRETRDMVLLGIGIRKDKKEGW